MRHLFLVLLLGACSIDIPDATFTCVVTDDCPQGWICHVDNRCYSDTPLPDAAVDSNADSFFDDTAPVDSGTDSAVPADSAAFDSSPDTDPDTGSPPRGCTPGAIYDAPLDTCIVREAGSFCTVGAPLQWLTEADQARIQGYVLMLGGSGQVGLTRPTGGTWRWPDGSAPPPLTWQTLPADGLGFAYLTPVGLQAFGSPYPFQLCALSPL